MKQINQIDEPIINKTIESLENHFFEVVYCNNKKEALNKLEKLINKNSTIGYGGSKTLEEIGFFEKFTIHNYPNLIDRKKSDNTPEKKKELQNKALTSDFFLSSANAVSQTGELVLIDKWGNRNAGMTYGPKKRIIIIGKNKIEPDLQSALNRAKNKASVLNNKRFDTKNPCTVTGICMNCNTSKRLCSVTTIIHRNQPPKSTLIILINEKLGF